MITTEYPTVLKKSKDRAMLERAHSTVIDQNTAIKMVYAYLDEDEAEVRFSGKTGRGKASGKARYIMLTGRPDKLTAGVVLHEVAHIICHNDKKTRGHGPEFVDILDDLVASEREWPA